ncbi:MAG TPA: hypothetical protein VM425_02800 [Myxococcota bacterium]|nr:hypothetical protein [Myxococcota bacterium]
MRSVIIVGLGAFLLALVAAGCGGENPGSACESHQSTVCELGIVYWQDGCGRREELIGACDCGCDIAAADCKTPCDCQPQCTGKCCGDNGCGGICTDACAVAGQFCNPVSCECEGTCNASTCDDLGKECGQWDDGCGVQLECGTCTEGDCGADGKCSCTEGHKRCQGASYQECQAGTFNELQHCGDQQACLVDLGCVDCDPAAGNVCSGGDVHACNPDGTVGDLVETCWTEDCVAGSCGNPACPPETMFIYVVDDSYRLLSFNPAGGANEFALIGNLDCPAGASWPDWSGGGTATPFSMSVDRSGRAWVLYTSGEIFWVSTTDASCQASPYPKGQDGFKLFGMGFVSDEAGSEAEHLFIAGGNVDAQVMGDMAMIDPNTLALTTIGSCPQAEYGPELTGTGKAEWFGYFPGSGSTFVAKLNKQSGQIDNQWALPGLSGDIRAWAFAHWGGKFYIFVTTYSGSYDSKVLRLDPDSGQTETLLDNLPYIIVGAGVSTCAPYR